MTFDMGEDRGRHVGVWSLVGLEVGWLGSPRRKSTALRVKRTHVCLPLLNPLRKWSGLFLV